MSMIEGLREILPDSRIKGRPIDRYSYARDASFYRLIPEVIVQPKDEKEIIALFGFSRQQKIPLVFRAAGTSLSGQSITDGILVEINQYWKQFSYDDTHHIIQAEPGLIGGTINRRLAPFKQKIGPDPASIDACMLGGMIANNASGMCCGVKDNAYHTLESIRFILPNGQVYDTMDRDANAKLLAQAPDIYHGLGQLHQQIKLNQNLYERIRDKYTRKNTLGYSLNALIDYERPIDILSHLMVGSEGTLGFISKVRLKTLADDPYKSTALLLFEDIQSAAEAVVPLRKADAKALELMDRASLRSIENDIGVPEEIKTLTTEAAALLCEFQASTSTELKQKVEQGLKALKTARLVIPARFTEDVSTRLQLWKVRKGLLPSVGAVRKSGTTVIIEDICFRLQDLAEATLELQGLLKKHGYDDAIIFGHAKDGNLHFVISQTFADEAGKKQYQAFIRDLVKMTVEKYDGTLKAEHGTGRNMAPFVETEWGPEAAEMMRTLKRLIDPDHLLNPGVIVNNDPEVYLKNIKLSPTIESEVDSCIECGFCESWCPSRDLTMTPRRRIATWREIQMLQQGDFAQRGIAKTLLQDYHFESVDTCAVDGLCAVGCPVNIDTGDLTRHFRHRQHGRIGHQLSLWTVRYFGFVLEMVRLGLNILTPLLRFVGTRRVMTLSRELHRRSQGKIPVWHGFMPTGGRGLPILRLHKGQLKKEVVYFVSCLNRCMDTIPGEAFSGSTSEAFIDLLQEGEIHPIYPGQLEDLCCGTPYSSKGYTEAFKRMAGNTVRSLWKASRKGLLPIVVDTSPCSNKMQHYETILEGRELEQWRKLKIVDIVEYLNDTLLPRLKLKKNLDKIVLHPTCSTRKMGLEEKMKQVAAVCANEVIIPKNVDCCGFAGDRGFLVPELTESATQKEAAEVREIPGVHGYYSSSRTCEMGISDATDKTYSSLIHLVHQAVFGRD